MIEPLRKAGKTIVIPPKSNRHHKRDYDEDVYKDRHLIENFFGKLKDFKRIALRACKTDTSFAAMIYAAATIISSQ